MENIQYEKVAILLLQQDKPISIEKLSILSDMPIKELEEVLRFFNSEHFLVYQDNWQKILITENARGQ